MSITNLEQLESAWYSYLQERKENKKKHLLENMKKSLDSIEGAREFLLEKLKYDGDVIKAFHKSEQSNIIANAIRDNGVSFQSVYALLCVNIDIAKKALEDCKSYEVERIHALLLDNFISYTIFNGKKPWEEVCRLCEKMLFE